MLERLKYINHMNEAFDFGKDGIFVNIGDIHNYEWTATKRGSRISALDRSIVTRKLPVIIMCDTEEKGIAARNRLMEITEKDVLALQHGKIVIGDFYFRCYVTKSQKADYLRCGKRYMKLTLTLTSDFPYWVKESTFILRKLGESGNGGGQKLDYPHDYPFDFFAGAGIQQLNNTGFVGTNFRMIIYGGCENPAIYVAGHKYQVNCTLDSNEYLTIDSVTKTIYKTAIDGTTTNMFSKRDRESYVFEKIPPGMCTVIWDGGFGVDITLLEERSEPLWT